MNTLNRLTLSSLACCLSLSISPLVGAKDKAPPPVGYSVGNLAPDLQMVRAQGGTLSLSSLRGSYVVLDLSTMWCFPSEKAAAEVRDTVSRLNAKSAIRGNESVVWVTAEFDGELIYGSPEPRNLARFAQKFGIGDALSPVVSFGPFSSDTYQAAAAQLWEYTLANFEYQGYPTFVIVDPEGVIIDVFQGFLPAEYGEESTLSRVMAAVGAKDTKNELRPAPYASLANTLSALDVTTTIDGIVSSATFELPGASTAPSSDSQFTVEAGASSADVFSSIGTYVRISRADGDDLDLESTYRLELDAALSPNAPFTNVSPVSGDWKVVVHPLSDPTSELWLSLPTALGADGQMPPVELQDVVDLLQPEIDEYFAEPVGVSEILAWIEWDGPVVSDFGMAGSL